MTCPDCRTPASPAELRRPAFATVTAITLIALAAVALTAIVTAAAADARRTRQAALEAQLRQLLLAGAATRSADWADAPPSQPWELALPDGLSQQAFHVTLSAEPRQVAGDAAAGEVFIQVEAKAPAARLAETLRFKKTPAGWQLVEAGIHDIRRSRGQGPSVGSPDH